MAENTFDRFMTEGLDKSKMILCIVGMHRSGTSLLANWLEACGVKIDFGSLMPATVWNKRGHFEDELIVSIHIDSLVRQIKDSRGWRVTTPGFLAFSKNEEARAREIISSRDDSPCWGWKDPRSIFFAPAWRKLSSRIRFVAIHRNPLQVVSSLLQRSAMSESLSPAQVELFHTHAKQATNMWIAHNKLILKLKEEYPHHTTIFGLEDLVVNDTEIFEHINNLLEGALLYSPIQSLVDPNILNQRPTEIDEVSSEGIRRDTKSVRLALINHSARSQP